MKFPFFICIIRVATPNGRTDITSILFELSMDSIREQTSTLFFAEQQTPSLLLKQHPVHEDILIIALRYCLFCNRGIIIRFMMKIDKMSTFRSKRICSGFIQKYSPLKMVPALFMTIPMSMSASRSNCSCSIQRSPRFEKLETNDSMRISLYSCDSSATLLSTVGLSMPISSRLKPISANSSAQARPIPSVKPVMATKQSPYFRFRLAAVSRLVLTKWEGSQLNRETVLCSHEAVLYVRAATPKRKRAFCRLGSSLGKRSERRQSAASARTAAFSVSLLRRAVTGLQSTRKDFIAKSQLYPNY